MKEGMVEETFFKIWRREMIADKPFEACGNIWGVS
jgi:hypothetical protein